MTIEQTKALRAEVIAALRAVGRIDDGPLTRHLEELDWAVRNKQLLQDACLDLIAAFTALEFALDAEIKKTAWHFRTQKEANAFIRQLLNSQPLKVPMPEPHHSFLSALLVLHPRAAEKIGAGIKHFTVEPARRGTRCFCLTRIDGTKTDFSTGKCVRGRE